MSLTAYIRYDSQGRIVPGGPIVTKTKPAIGNWQVVTEGTSVTLVGQLRAFVKLDRYNKPLAGSLFLGKSKPATGKWIEVNATYEGAVAPTTTTTTSSSTSTTTTTTTQAVVYSFNLNYIPRYGDNGSLACALYSQGPFVTFYSNVATLVSGSVLYNDPQLTSPYSGTGTEAWFAGINNGTQSAMQIGSVTYGNTGIILSIIPCSQITTTTTTTSNLIYADYEASRFTQFLCPPQTGAIINVGVPGGDIATASIIYCNFQPTFTSNDTIFVKFNVDGTYYTRQFITNSTATSATPTGSPVACS